MLTRNVGQTIHIGDDIKVTVLRVKGEAATVIGIEAPKAVAVVRSELPRGWTPRAKETPSR